MKNETQFAKAAYDHGYKAGVEYGTNSAILVLSAHLLRRLDDGATAQDIQALLKEALEGAGRPAKQSGGMADPRLVTLK